MAFARASVFQSCFRAARPATSRPRVWQHVARRCYASGGHGHAQSGGDATWAIGAVAVTVPSCYYLLQHAPDNSHGHDDHGDGHGEVHAQEATEEAKEESEESSDDGDAEAEKSGASDNDDETKETDTPDTSDDESKDGDKEDIKKEESGKSASKEEAKDKPSADAGSDAKHSTDAIKSESKKSEGVSDSAKVKGTVDSKRPQA